MFILLKCIHLRDAEAGALSALIGDLEDVSASLSVHSHFLGRTSLNSPAEAQILWRLNFATEADYEACLPDPLWHGRLTEILKPESGIRTESIAYQQIRHGARRPDIRNGVWRALIMSVLDGTSRAERQQFEADILCMPQYIASIRNWSLGRVVASTGSRRWSYVWEQDFDDTQGPFGEYRAHPLHWGIVDNWFDVENPRHIMDGRLLRVVCESARSVVVPEKRSRG
jgi:hypothetical protein